MGGSLKASRLMGGRRADGEELGMATALQPAFEVMPDYQRLLSDISRALFFAPAGTGIGRCHEVRNDERIPSRSTP